MTWMDSGQYEGDMILNSEQMSAMRGEITMDLQKYIWPNNTVPYVITSCFNQTERNIIHEAARKFAEVSCVTVRPRRRGEKNYVLISGDKKGCNAELGFRNRVQSIHLERTGCVTQSVVQHEFLHSLGFHHQHAAHNRDDYVYIYRENIKDEFQFAFNKEPESMDQSYGTTYDYQSIMHYPSFAFSKNKKNTIVRRNDMNTVIEYNYIMTESDIRKLNAMYCSGENEL
ncbi:low choriolytic enzyme-like [Ctenocephalides felis]|uniref:low choriolytic enzyme-like n=1 Tax=Ctenocephalides felis TaxID=7515 RepID=UPI000E6E578D|nr:low choriolytic enzyme-like [Ctenocephalides felis]